jgi:hypothetical protein
MDAPELKKWRVEKFAIIFFLIILSFLIVPYLVQNDYSYAVLQFCFFALMILVVYSINSAPFLRYVEIACIIPFFIFNIVSLFLSSMTYILIAYGFSVAFMLLVIFDLIKSFIYSPIINTNLIFGTLIVYFLAGVLWAKIYFVGNIIYPGSFDVVNKLIDFTHITFKEAYNIQFNLVYYSFCVLTTLGLGDIVPIHNQAKALTILEAMFGQLFIAIVIAKLVATWHHNKLKNS